MTGPGEELAATVNDAWARHEQGVRGELDELVTVLDRIPAGDVIDADGAIAQRLHDLIGVLGIFGFTPASREARTLLTGMRAGSVSPSEAVAAVHQVRRLIA